MIPGEWEPRPRPNPPVAAPKPEPTRIPNSSFQILHSLVGPTERVIALDRLVVAEQGSWRKPGGVLQVPARALVRRVLSRIDQRRMDEHEGDVPLVAFRTADGCLFMSWRHELH